MAVFAVTTSGSKLEVNIIRDITLNGISFNDSAGGGVASGDLNDDGIPDLIVGARIAGAVYVLFGPFDGTGKHCTGGFPCKIDLSNYNVRLLGDAAAGPGIGAFGDNLASGDLNGDDKDDLVVGADFASPNGKETAGRTFVIFGPLTAGSFNISDVRDITLDGIDIHDHSGAGLAIGDLNNDTKNDLVIGAHSADPPNRSDARETYVLHGPFDGTGTHCTGSFPCTIDLANADLIVNGIAAGDNSGVDVVAVDLNDDAAPDLVVGANHGVSADPGEAYVVFGPLSTGKLELSSADIVLNGIDATDLAGSGLGDGDLNGDGATDLIVGAIWGDPGGRTNAGEAYVLHGPFDGTGTHCAGGFPCKVALTDADFTINGISADDEFGSGVATADLDGNGADDLIIGAAAHDADAGHAYVIFLAAQVDSDGDGCTDKQELQAKSLAAAGGGRDPLYFWDFFDTWAAGSRTRNIDGFDIGGVVARFGTVSVPPLTKEEALAEALTPPTDTTGYHAAYDRDSPDPEANVWNAGPPSGNIDGFDIGGVVVQFGHTCVVLP